MTHMDFQLGDPRNLPAEDQQVAALLMRAFVNEGHTDRANAERLVAPGELRKRGALILARSSPTGTVVGMVILAEPTSPTRQVARPDEAEVQLLAVDPAARGHGLGKRLVVCCEQKARALGYARMVLSTQPVMTAAQRIYAGLGYRRNAERDWARPDGRAFLVYEKQLTA